MAKKNKLVCVVLCYTDGKKQLSCFDCEERADAFIRFPKMAQPQNVKYIKKMYFDAIYPIINYAKE